MDISIAMPGRPKDVLVRGAVRVWHVGFILLLAYVVAEIVAAKLTLGLDSVSRRQFFTMISTALNATVCIAFIIVVPEFRRSLRVLFASPAERVQATDFAWAFTTMLCWGYGLYHIAFLAPLMQLKPEWFGAMGYHDVAAPVSLGYLALASGTVVVAPVAEELMYRGFLMNLWIARWGIWGGVIASSIVFGLFHLQNALFASVMGFAFALVYLKYDSLWPGIAMHSAYNLLAFEPLLGHVFWSKNHLTIQDLANWIPSMIVTVVFFPVAYVFWRRFRPIR
jgi:membrane protease YdiL (CAAX protease family)